MIIKYLKYPAIKQVNERQQKQVKIIISVLITIMLLPSSYLAYSLYREQQFRKNADLFIENEFSNKGYTVVYKKTDFNAKSKKLELAFLSKRFDEKELASLRAQLAENPYLKGTNLVIRQDSTDRFNALRGDILNQIKGSENEMNEKDVKIAQLEKELAKNTINNRQFLKESQLLFPSVTSLSISRNELVTARDSTTAITAVIYDVSKVLSEEDQAKFRDWLNARLSVKDVQLFRKQ